jgi:predicted RNA-binding protein YlxR (DUF448 family)
VKQRMCVVCRERLPQQSMHRLQCKNSELMLFSGSGRSFYLCKNCENSKKLDKIIKRICKKNISIEKIKEIIIYED